MTDWQMPKGVRRVPIPVLAEPQATLPSSSPPRAATPKQAQKRAGRPSAAPKSPKADGDALFLAALRQRGLPQPVREHRFDTHGKPQRQWRFDYCWPLYSLALEVEGGVWVKGRHNRGAGYIKDLEKYSEAAAQGWLLLRVTPQQLCEDRTFQWIRRAMDNTHPSHGGTRPHE